MGGDRRGRASAGGRPRTGSFEPILLPGSSRFPPNGAAGKVSRHEGPFRYGEGCLATPPAAEIRSVDAPFLSHSFIDRVTGLDPSFRSDFARPEAPMPADAGDEVRLHPSSGKTGPP